jgi:predicted nuclease of predicted toxin-antitoxin system
MLRLLADENVNDDVVTGVLRRAPHLDFARALEVGLGKTDDRKILEWAAAAGRVIVTADVNTMVGFAIEQARGGLPMAGVLCLVEGVTVAEAIENILIAAECSTPEEARDQIVYLPLHFG